MPSSYPWMSYAAAHAWEKEAKAHGVSEVARSAKGFLREYAKAGSAAAMRKRPLEPSGSSKWTFMKSGGRPA